MKTSAMSDEKTEVKVGKQWHGKPKPMTLERIRSLRTNDGWDDLSLAEMSWMIETLETVLQQRQHPNQRP